MATYQEQLARRKAEREAKEKLEAERKARALSPEQIENWRKALTEIVGPFALVMPESMVQEFRDLIQQRLDREGKVV